MIFCIHYISAQKKFLKKLKKFSKKRLTIAFQYVMIYRHSSRGLKIQKRQESGLSFLYSGFANFQSKNFFKKIKKALDKLEKM